jgi:hypothetical protein
MIILTILIMEMVTSLEEKLTRVSQSFSDQNLRFLFLINITYFIWQQLHQYHLTRKIDRYIESYLQVSWAPMLKSMLHRYGIPIRRYRYGDTLIRHFLKIRIRRYGKYINILKKSVYIYLKKISIHLLGTIFTLAEQFNK